MSQDDGTDQALLRFLGAAGAAALHNSYLVIELLAEPAERPLAAERVQRLAGEQRQLLAVLDAAIVALGRVGRNSGYVARYLAAIERLGAMLDSAEQGPGPKYDQARQAALASVRSLMTADTSADVPS